MTLRGPARAAFATGAAGALWVLAGYPLALRALPARPWRRADETPDITIIVPAYNEHVALPIKLAAMDDLDYPRERVQVIVAVDADRELADLAGACDVLGIAVSGGTGTDLEPLLHRCAEQGPDRPLAVTLRPTGPDLDARAEAVATVLGRARGLASSVPLHHVTVTDLDALAHSLS